MVRIFVEGKGDEKFIDSYIKHLAENNTLDDYEIISTSGWTNLHLLVNQFQENSDTGGTNIVIFDADYEANNGGFNTRSQQLAEKIAELAIEATVFLFPTNTENGDYELLLERIVNPSHGILLNCFENYEQCVRNGMDGTDLQYALPLRKAKIYSYISSMPTSRKEKEKIKKGDFLFENTEYWNLDSVVLDPLKAFLIDNL